MAASIIDFDWCWSSHFPADLYNFLTFSRHMCSYKALLLNNLSTPIITICCFSHSECSNPLIIMNLFLYESMSRNESINLFNTRDLEHCAAWSILPSIWKQKYYFPGGGIILTGIYKFLLNDFCVDFFLQILGDLVKLHCDFFLGVSNDWASSLTSTFGIEFWSFFELFADSF